MDQRIWLFVVALVVAMVLPRRRARAEGSSIENGSTPPDPPSEVAGGDVAGAACDVPEWTSRPAAGELHGLVGNLRAGFALALLRSVSPARLHVSVHQVAGLVAASLGAGFVCEWILTEPPRAVSPGGWAVQAGWLLATFALGYLVARERAEPAALQRVLVYLLSPLLAGWIGFAVLEVARHRWESFSVWIDEADLYYGYLFAAWLLPVYAHAIRQATAMPAARAIALSALYAAVVFQALEAWPSAYVVFTEEADVDLVEEDAIEVDVEALLHAQRTRVEERIGQLAPQRPGVVDLYLVALAADATQNVFRNEVEYVQELFDRRFDTRGRSLLLVNHEGTLGELPIGSASNLEDALTGVARVMDLQEDVLFLYLTGHGSRTHELHVNLPGFPLNAIRPARLAAILDRSGISWRTIAVSACYSGGYVEHLLDSRSLVMTAAARDRKSFGCSASAELTYFARAYFEQELEHRFDFVGAFESARERIAAREQAEGLTPSLPQIAVGAEIRSRLDALAERLASAAAASAERAR